MDLDAACSIIGISIDRLQEQHSIAVALGEIEARRATGAGCGRGYKKLRVPVSWVDAMAGKEGSLPTRSLDALMPLLPPPSEQFTKLPWREFLAMALDQLKADRDRLWALRELSIAIKDASVVRPRGKGFVHQLYVRLQFIGAVETEEGFRVRASRFIDRIVYREAAAPPAPVEAPAPASPNELDRIDEELGLLGPLLPGLSPEQRAGHLAVWAGQARRYIETLDVITDNHPQWGRAQHVLQRLRELSGSTFVAALDTSWEFEDWPLYIKTAEKLAGGTSSADMVAGLTHDEAVLLHEGNLRGLLAYIKDPKRFDREEAERVVRETTSEITADNLTFQRVVKALGSAKSEPVAKLAKAHDVSPQLVAVTKGMRVLVAGGQGERDAHRQSLLEAFSFDSVEWVCAEKEKARPFQKLGARIKSFDVVFLLVGYTSHAAGNALIALCKKAKAKLVMIKNGYSVHSFAAALEEQYLSYLKPAPKRAARGAR